MIALPSDAALPFLKDSLKSGGASLLEAGGLLFSVASTGSQGRPRGEAQPHRAEPVLPVEIRSVEREQSSRSHISK